MYWVSPVYVRCGGKGTAPGCAQKREPKGTKRRYDMLCELLKNGKWKIGNHTLGGIDGLVGGFQFVVLSVR